MKLKLSTILISVVLIGLLLYGFISLTSNDPYSDYAPGTELSITNNSSADTVTPGNWPYATVWNWNYGGISGVNGGTVGACYHADKYWLNRWNGSQLYFYDNSGTNGGPGTQTTATYTGSIRDMTMAPDGSGTDFIWGGKASTTLYKFNPSGTTAGTYSIPQQMRAIVWDPNRKGFWAANWTTDIKCYDTTGALKDTYAGGLALASKYGMAWDSGHAHVDTATLFVWHQTPGQTLTEVNLTTKTTIRSFLISAGTHIAGGAEAYKAHNSNDWWLALNYQNWAVVAYKIGEEAPGVQVPEILYYTFDESQSDSTQNFAVPGGGSPWAPVPGLTLGGTGQFGGALQGNGQSSSSNYVNTGWAPDLGGSSWTISVWMNGLHSTTALNYLWGDPTAGPSWRCFYSGAAGTHGVLQRLGVVGGTDITVPGVGPGPTVLHLVYDSAAGVVKAYKNGVFSNQQTQAGALNITGSGPFKVGGYSSSTGLNAGGLMDEFRFYRRALDTAEISATWNQTLVTGGIGPVLPMIPDDFYLSQNYPNPFNPTTTIDFKVPLKGLVTLKVYDVTGKEVATLINGVKHAGNHSIEFNASGLSSGIYFYQIIAGDFMDVKKMVLLK